MEMPELDVPGPPATDALENRIIRKILEGTAGSTGTNFFHDLVRAVAQALGVKGAWVTEFAGPERMEALAFWINESFVDGFVYELAGTPCEHVIHECRTLLIRDRVVELYPGDPDLTTMIDAVSYLGAPLQDVDGHVIGNLAILHDQPLTEDPLTLGVFQIFAARASAELQRLRAEQASRDHAEEVELLIASAMDAIIGLDPGFTITRANTAAAEAFRIPAATLTGQDFSRFLTGESRRRLRILMEELEASGSERTSCWVHGGFEGVRRGGTTFPAEATLSRFRVRERTCFTLILRDESARRHREERLTALSAEAEYLRAELEVAQSFGEIVGTSPAIQEALDAVRQVAATDATVLLLGETGTGKELVARAIHRASSRHDKPLVRVNCAAMPATLIESEFFGHAKGAFTGATVRREGRFALADGGTIFLDEVGELPIALQAKLLRVLQDGEFEPVGSSVTRRVDVRVVAATNRYLEAAVRAGDFREDLYYRLNVFPIVLPPLRERDDDVRLLAETFLDRFARRMARPLSPLSEMDITCLRSYSWPGNVRELHNVIERAVITARGGRVKLDFLPSGEFRSVETTDVLTKADADGGRPVLTCEQLRDLERANLIRALEKTGWRVAGSGGAAGLLGVPPSTLSSRMRALGVARPA